MTEKLNVRTAQGQWLFCGDDPTIVEHRRGRGMWHPNTECTLDRCGAIPSDAHDERNKFAADISADDFADGIKATLDEFGNLPVVDRPALPRVFSVIRYDDVSGVSGTGIVAQGVQFRDGQVVLQWCCPGLPGSVAVWASIEDVLQIHGHRGRTVVKWADGRD